ncbi:Ig-like domain-containing protein [Bacillus sp. EAC]|uniref:Ig-like domain-containing protein n=1 Tax=Bacillus sp. EAC TaxID=1978338 RepID=UPI000B44C2A3|nr:Ig-like domain-containing protein [Bacillus sp. EAC]
MKSLFTRFLSLILIFTLLVPTSSNHVFGEVNQVSTNTNVINQGDIEAAIGKSFAKMMSSGTISGDWVALAAARSGITVSTDIKTQRLATIENYVKGNLSVTDIARTIIGIVSLGGDPTNIGNINLVEKLYQSDSVAMNAKIFSLIALDTNNYEIPLNAKTQRDALITGILSLQHIDGGWSLSSNLNSASDPDITGMAMTALSKYNSQPLVKTAIDKAADFFSVKQLPTGGFASYGTENSNSASQVLMGLTSNNIDPTSASYTKNGNNVVTTLLSYQLPDGGFKWMTSDTKNNSLALEQALYALDQYIFYLNGKGSIYDFVNSPVIDPTPIVDKTNLQLIITEIEALTQGNYTDSSWQTLQISLNNAKLVLANTKATQNEVDSVLSILTTSKQALQTKPVAPQTISVSLTVNGLSTAAKKDVSIPNTNATIEAGKTVSDVFEKVLTEKGIPFTNNGGNYISTINGLSEFDGGPNSGWLYSVNGIDPNIGVGQYVLNNGDNIVIRYTDDYTKEPSQGGGNGGGSGSGGSPSPISPQIDQEINNIGLPYDNKQPIDKVGKTTAVQNSSAKMSVQQSNELKKKLQENIISLSKSISNSSDTTVKDNAEEVSIIVPANSISKDTIINIQELQLKSSEQLSSVYEFTPNGTIFNKPVYISIKVPIGEIDLNNIVIAWLDEKSNKWIPIPALLNASTGVITGKVNHFTKYAVIDRSKLNDLDSQIVSVTNEVKEAVNQIVNSGTLSDWEAFGLARSGYILPNSYLLQVEKSLKDENGEFRKVTDYERIAIAIKAAGGNPMNIGGYNLIEKIYNNERMIIQGINGPTFALLALDSGNYQIPANAKWTRETLVDWLLQQQNVDGGFPLSKGDKSSVDITAMVLTSLSSYKDQVKVKNAVDQALEWLSKEQLQNGGYMQYGEESSESVSQVIIALSSLGIKSNSIAFKKVNGDLLTNLFSFKNKDGGFSHTHGQSTNEMATEQALMALVSIDRNNNGKEKIYQLVSNSKFIIAEVSNNSNSVSGQTYPDANITIKNKSGKVLATTKGNSKGVFNTKIPVQSAGNILYFTIESSLVGNEVYTYKVLDRVSPVTPNVSQVDNNDRIIKGTAEKYSTIYAYVGSKEIGFSKANSLGHYTISVSAQKARVTIKLYATDASGNKSQTRIVNVLDKTPPVIPTVSSATSKSTLVTGKGEVYSTIYIFNGNKLIAKTSVTSKKTFKVIIPKQKKGSTLKIYAQDRSKNKTKVISYKIK